ncbi:hypothetical protein LCGC14_1134570 [marine sediment metagenome]|uniref:Uncharacterized protein n=1 Tax=marine sediment metagenome TaxID=412755 RepID=A0A0F9M091_9ZZZZ
MSTPEEIRYDGQQQDREDKRREMLERRARMGGPDAPEPCEDCDGKGFTNETYPPSECPCCLGTGVQP